jgi:hypothetical protein
MVRAKSTPRRCSRARRELDWKVNVCLQQPLIALSFCSPATVGSTSIAVSTTGTTGSCTSSARTGTRSPSSVSGCWSREFDRLLGVYRSSSSDKRGKTLECKSPVTVCKTFPLYIGLFNQNRSNICHRHGAAYSAKGGGDKATHHRKKKCEKEEATADTIKCTRL